MTTEPQPSTIKPETGPLHDMSGFVESQSPPELKLEAGSMHDVGAVVSLSGLTKIMRSRPRGVSGPESKISNDVVSPGNVTVYLDRDVRNWRGSTALVREAATQLRKLVDREKIDPILVSTNLNRELAEKINILAPLAEFPTGKTSMGGLQRMIMNLSTYDAEYYLSEDYLTELQDMAGNDASLKASIGHYFTIQEMLRRYASDRDAIEATRASVAKAVDIARDPAAYIEAVTGSIPSQRFIREMSHELILHATTQAAMSVDETFAEYYTKYEKLSEMYPRTSAIPRFLMSKLKNSASFELIAERFTRIEHALDVYESSDRKRDYMIARKMYNGGTYQEALGVSFAARTPEGPRKEAAAKRGNLQSADYSALEHGLQYRTTLFDIDESEALTSDQKKDFYAGVRKFRENAHLFAQKCEVVIGSQAQAIYQGIDQRNTEMLYAIKYFAENGDAPRQVHMGSKTFEVSVTAAELARSLTFMNVAMEKMATIGIGEGMSDVAPSAANLELGYVAGTDDSVLLVSKTEADAAPNRLIRGRSPRLNFVVGMGGITPSTVASEREQSCLSIRFDYDNGALVVDLGGKTDNPYTPDFVVAKCISLGASLRGQESGIDGQDYHIKIADMSEADFSNMVVRMRAAIHLSGTALRVPPAQQ